MPRGDGSRDSAARTVSLLQKVCPALFRHLQVLHTGHAIRARNAAVCNSPTPALPILLSFANWYFGWITFGTGRRLYAPVASSSSHHLLWLLSMRGDGCVDRGWAGFELFTARCR